jgi:hypothetical protein
MMLRCPFIVRVCGSRAAGRRAAAVLPSTLQRARRREDRHTWVLRPVCAVQVTAAPCGADGPRSVRAAVWLVRVRCPADVVLGHSVGRSGVAAGAFRPH